MFDRCLVISDMDGTLLNHHDYQVDAALPMLESLNKQGVPVIFNTSKTFAELKDWVLQLNNHHPFIVENGSAIYIPDNYFPESFRPELLSQLDSIDGYQIVLTGIHIQSIKEFINKLNPNAIDLTECSIQKAIEITGLSESEALAAQTRQFSVPLMFKDNDEQNAFSEQARKAGFGILKGGRFLHILGRCDKGRTLQVLKQLYEQCYQKKYAVIALGDSPNDLAMLEQSDVAVIVNSPSSHSFTLNHPSKILTLDEAPRGWVEGVESAFKKINITLN